MNKEVYLDNSATTRPYEDVIRYMSETALECYGNPSSLHKKGIEAERLVKKARVIIARSLNAQDSEIIFTSSGTESNNLAILGYLEANARKGRHVITSAIEHPSVLEVFRYLSEKGYGVDFVKVDGNGVVDLDMLESLIRDDTALISIMVVNNETGTIQPVEEIAKLRDARNPDAVIHVDAVQAFGKVRLNPSKSGIGLMSVSSHKIHGPKGVGALFVDKNIRIKPLFHGGGQESLLRSGTENVPGICGFGLAAEIALENMNRSYDHVKKLKKLLLESLSKIEGRYRVISPESALPYIVNIAFPGVKSEVLLHHLEERNIYVSTGSACSSRKKMFSHVLEAMNVPPAEMDGAIRISFSCENDESDVEAIVEALSEIVPKLQNIRRGPR